MSKKHACANCERLKAEAVKLRQQVTEIDTERVAAEARAEEAVEEGERLAHYAWKTKVARSAAERHRDRLAKALRKAVKRWMSHSGLCCTFDDAGKVVVTDESCKCDDLSKECRAALADTPEHTASLTVEGTDIVLAVTGPAQPPCPNCAAAEARAEKNLERFGRERTRANYQEARADRLAETLRRRVVVIDGGRHWLCYLCGASGDTEQRHAAGCPLALTDTPEPTICPHGRPVGHLCPHCARVVTDTPEPEKG